MDICCICGEGVKVEVINLADGNKKFLNAIKIPINEGEHKRVVWHDYCGAALIFAVSQQKKEKDPKVRAMAEESLRKITIGANKIKLVPKEFLYA